MFSSDNTRFPMNLNLALLMERKNLETRIVICGEKLIVSDFFFPQKVRDTKQLPVDLTALMEGLSSLLLPSQTAMFSQHMYD